MIDRTCYGALQRVARLFCGHQEGGESPPLTRDEPAIDTYAQAFHRLQNPSALSSQSYWARRDAIDWGPVSPDLQRFSKALIARFAAYQVPMFVHNAFRSGPEQDELFKRGVTRAKAGQSPHNHGFAVDIVHYGFYWELTRKEWELVGALGKDVARSNNLRLVWGGDFKSLWDPAHWELSAWKTRV